jgi:hypothetical protein
MGMFNDLRNLNTPQEPKNPLATSAPLLAPETTLKKPVRANQVPSNRPIMSTQTEIEKFPTAERQNTGLPANPQTGKPVEQQNSLPANLQTGKPADLQDSKPANQQTSKQTKKFSSYLLEESIRALKRLALDEDKKDYEVLQEALDEYLQKKGYRSS